MTTLAVLTVQAFAAVSTRCREASLANGLRIGHLSWLRSELLSLRPLLEHDTRQCERKPALCVESPDEV